MRLLRVRGPSAAPASESARQAVAAQMAEVARLQRDLRRARARYEAALAEIEAREGSGTASSGRSHGGSEAASSAPTTTAPVDADDGEGGGRISLATASLEALRELGLSVTQTNRVLDHRARGELQTVDDLDAVPGIPKAKLRHVKERLRA